MSVLIVVESRFGNCRQAPGAVAGRPYRSPGTTGAAAGMHGPLADVEPERARTWGTGPAARAATS